MVHSYFKAEKTGSLVYDPEKSGTQLFRARKKLYTAV